MQCRLSEGPCASVRLDRQVECQQADFVLRESGADVNIKVSFVPYERQKEAQVADGNWLPHCQYDTYRHADLQVC